jgi:hypothetical protein
MRLITFRRMFAIRSSIGSRRATRPSMIAAMARTSGACISLVSAITC